MTYLTKSDILERRKKIYAMFGPGSDAPRVTRRSLARQQLQETPPLTLETDVLEPLEQAKAITKFKTQQDALGALKAELRESQMRLRKVKNGCPLSTLLDDNQPKIPVVRTPRRLRGYVYPTSHKMKTTSEEAQNRLNRFLYSIQEEDEQRNKKLMENLEFRSSRRKKAIEEQYQDYVRYGLTVAQKNATRSEAISALRRRRGDDWWGELISEMAEQPEAKDDLKIAEMLAGIETFNNSTIEKLLEQCKAERLSVATTQKMVHRANQLGSFVAEIPLMLVFNYVYGANGHSMAPIRKGPRQKDSASLQNSN